MAFATNSHYRSWTRNSIGCLIWFHSWNLLHFARQTNQIKKETFFPEGKRDFKRLIEKSKIQKTLGWDKQTIIVALRLPACYAG